MEIRTLPAAGKRLTRLEWPSSEARPVISQGDPVIGISTPSTGFSSAAGRNERAPSLLVAQPCRQERCRCRIPKRIEGPRAICPYGDLCDDVVSAPCPDDKKQQQSQHDVLAGICTLSDARFRQHHDLVIDSGWHCEGAATPGASPNDRTRTLNSVRYFSTVTCEGPTAGENCSWRKADMDIQIP